MGPWYLKRNGKPSSTRMYHNLPSRPTHAPVIDLAKCIQCGGTVGKLWNFWNFSSNNLKLTRLGTSASKFFWNFYQLKNREYKGSNNVNFQVLVVISDFFCPLEKISRHKLSVSFFVSFVGGPKAINSSSSSLQKESNASKRWQYCPSVKFNRCKNSNVK